MYQRLLKWCHDSEVILFARLQTFGGVLLMLVSTVLPIVSSFDLTVFGLSPKVIGLIGLTNGVVTELLRKYRATDLGPGA